MGIEFIGYKEALGLTLEHIHPLDAEEVPLVDSTNRVLKNDVFSVVDSPSADTSLKDGYAVRSEEVFDATPANPAKLNLLDVAAAGLPSRMVIKPGTAIRILTGAEVPEGADTVVSEEFTLTDGSHVIVSRQTESGRNILLRGCDVAKNEITIRAGSKLTPGKVGLLAAAGHDKVSVIRKPRVAIIAIGDEVTAPGQPLTKGKLYASNMVTLNAWCSRHGMDTTLDIVGDDEMVIMEKLRKVARRHDAVLTSGGAWTGDRDLVVRVLIKLGWQKLYHHVRIGPGKAVGFGLLRGKPVFVLPGGPPSNLVAFLHLALPGLFKLAGNDTFQIPNTSVVLSNPVRGQPDWTQFIFGRIKRDNNHYRFDPDKQTSRLRCIAEADGIISIPEGVDHIPAEEEIAAIDLDSFSYTKRHKL